MQINSIVLRSKLYTSSGTRGEEKVNGMSQLLTSPLSMIMRFTPPLSPSGPGSGVARGWAGLHNSRGRARYVLDRDRCTLIPIDLNRRESFWIECGIMRGTRSAVDVGRLESTQVAQSRPESFTLDY